MAKQFGTHTLRGTVGDVTYTMSKNGNKARQRTIISPKKRAENPNLDIVRQQAAEFGRAAKAASLLKNAFQPLILRCGDDRLRNRFTSLMNKVVKSDPVNRRGERNVLDGNLEQFKDFNFNEGATLIISFMANYTLALDRAAGLAKMTTESFLPKKKLRYPPNAVAYKISLGVALVDFETGEKQLEIKESEYLPLETKDPHTVDLAVNFPPASTLPLFVAIRLDFARMVNDLLEPVGNNTFTSCAIVKVDIGA